MPQAPASKIKGLYKHHNRACRNKGGKPEKCGCPWYGYYQGAYKGLAEWSGKEVDPRSRRKAEVVFNRLKAAVDNRTYSAIGEEQSLGSGQRFSEFVKEWRTHYAETYGLSSNSLVPMLDVLWWHSGTAPWSTLQARRSTSSGGWIGRKRSVSGRTTPGIATTSC